MAIQLTQLLTVLGTATVGAGVVVSGGYIYINSDKIFKSSGRSVAPAIKYDYLVAEVKTAQNNTDNPLYKNSNKNYQCKFVFQDKDPTLDDTCEIFSLSSTTSNEVVNLNKDRFSTNSLSTNTTTFTASSHVIVKLKPELTKALTTSTNKVFSIVSKGENSIETYSLEYVFHISHDDMGDKLSDFATPLFGIKVTTASTHSNALTDASEYECQIGSSSEKLPCKLFTYTTPTAAYTHTNLKTLTPSISSASTTLAANSYAVIQLTGTKKTYLDLQNQEITVSLKTGSSEIVKGYFDSLLIGNVSSTANASKLFPVENLDNHTVNASTSETDTALILTKGAAAHKPTLTFAENDYLCRVIVNKEHFDDETCKLSEIDKNASTLKTLNIANYPGTSDPNKITAIAELAADKYQVVSIKSSLQKKLASLSEDNKLIHIIKKADKAKAWNNKVVTLSWQSDVTNPAITEPNKLVSNLFLVRSKSKGTGLDATDLTQPLKCEIDGFATQTCSVYKMATDLKTNALTKDILSTTSTTISALTDLDADKFVILKLSGQSIRPSDLFNKQIKLKSNDSTKLLATLEYDQILFGSLPPSTASEQHYFPIPRAEESYLIEKDSTFTTTSSTGAIGDKYRCSLEFTTAKGTNYDDACKLIVIAATPNKKALTYAELIALSTKDVTTNFSTETKTFYKLTLDKNLIYNLDFDSISADARIAIYKLPVSGDAPTTPLVKFKIKNKIESTLGSTQTTSLLLAKVAETPGASSNITAPKCSFAAEDTTGFECGLRKLTNIPINANDFTELAIPATELVTPATFTVGDYYTIDLKTNSQTISSLTTNQSIYYHFTDNTTAKKVKFDIPGILAGSLTVTGNLTYLKTPTVTA